MVIITTTGIDRLTDYGKSWCGRFLLGRRYDAHQISLAKALAEMSSNRMEVREAATMLVSTTATVIPQSSICKLNSQHPVFPIAAFGMDTSARDRNPQGS